MNLLRWILLAGLPVLGWGAAAAPFPAIPDAPFVQEYREEAMYPRAVGEARAIVVGADGGVWLAAKGGVFRYAGGEWTKALDGSAYSLAVRRGDVWAGTWQGLYRIREGRAERVDAVEAAPVPAVFADAMGVAAMTQSTLYEFDEAKGWRGRAWMGARSMRAMTRDRSGALWVATGMGAYVSRGDRFRELYREAELLAGELRGAAAAPDGAVWLGGIGGLDVYRGDRRSGHFNVSGGMPNQDVRCVAVEPDGTVWAGTALGAVRRIGSRWSLLHSRRWLPSDDVKAIAVGADRTVWVATGSGLSAIRRREMTLAEKADHYLNICLTRHVRPPYLVEQCNLKGPGDVEHFVPRDDDNEGGYTGVYLAMESYRYAATRDPRARENAAKAFRAMRFLREVTGTSGFFARTVVPSDWTKMADANRTFTPQERADEWVENPRAKLLENRWRPSADGKWLWKGDTSSDEMTMHMFGYLTYYNLAADEAEKAAIRDHVRRIVDYLIEGGYTFRDIDGKPTKWGVWAPEKLNGDPDWRAERWLNGLEMLGYLELAGYLTGDGKYRRAAEELAKKNRYDLYARHPLATEPSERTHFDDELAGAALTLALLERTSSELRGAYEQGLGFWWGHVRSQGRPLFAFQWASLKGARSGEEFGLQECVEELRGEPLDLVQWTVDSRKREDVRLVHEPVLDDVQVDRVLAPGERATMRSDSNVYSAVRGEDGMSESSGVFWLLPYWMARYYGYIGAPR